MPVELKNISYTYAPGSAYAARALENVSLRIDDGEFVGIMGHTGCGKSTLIQLIAGLLTPSSGTVLLDGEDINAKNYDRSKLRRRVGVVFQYPEYQLFETTVERDVAFGLRHLPMSREEKTRAVREALETVGFDPEQVMDKSPLGFSGGEKRRIAIAGVLAPKPEILILDEPVAGLDPLGRSAFLKMTDRLNEAGVTVIMISHNADVLCEHAGRLVVLNSGRIVCDGPAEQLFDNAELLRENRVSAGQVRQLAELLRQRGVEIRPGTVRYGQLLEQLEKLYGRKVP